MNFFTNLTNTPATNFARAQYFSAVTATKDSKTYAVIDLSKRLASLATAIILLVPVINIIAERILRAAGFHTPRPRPPSSGQGSASRGSGNTNPSRSNPNPQSSSSRSTNSGSPQSRQQPTTPSPVTASSSRSNPPAPAAANPQPSTNSGSSQSRQPSMTSSPNAASSTRQQSINPPASRVATSSSNVATSSTSAVTSLADRVRIVISAKKGPGTEENDVYYLQIKAQPETGVTALPIGNKKMIFAFCVDVSGSMDDCGRLINVRAAMILFFEKALAKIIEEDAEIWVSIVTFSGSAKTVLANTLLTEDNITSVQNTVLKDLIASGSTNIMAGLDVSSLSLQQMKTACTAASAALLVLTDGKNDVEIEPISFRPIHERLAQSDATFMALGAGKGHEEAFMRMATTDQRPQGSPGAFSSIYNYIADNGNAQAGGLTTQGAVNKIFKEISNQQIDNMLCEVKGIDQNTVTFLNDVRKDGNAYHLGGLSSTDVNVKIVRVEMPKGQNPLNNARFEIALISGNTSAKVSVPVDENEDPEILTEALNLETLAVIKACEGYGLSNDEKKKKIEEIAQSLIKAEFMDEQFNCTNTKLAKSIASLLRLKTALDRQVTYQPTFEELQERTYVVRGRRDE